MGCFKYYSIFFLLLCSLNSGKAQLTQEQFIQGVAAYRSLVIDDAIEVLIKFNLLVDSLKHLSDHPEKHEEFREFFIHNVLYERYWSVKDLVQEGFTYLEPGHMKTYRNWGSKNAFVLHELNILAANNIIETRPPYKLADLNEFWKEVTFYDVHDNQKILDLGTGNGFISFIFALSGIQSDFYLSEIDVETFTYLSSTIDKIVIADKGIAELLLIESREKVIGIDSVKFDRILMREVFHHLSHSNEILKSVNNNLSDDGQLIIVETTRDLNIGDERRCPQSITRGKIIKSVTKNGFELIDDKVANDSTMLKFKKRS